MKMKISFTDGKADTHTKQGNPVSISLSWCCAGSLAAHTPVPFRQPQRQELTWGVESVWNRHFLAQRYQESPEVWDPRHVESTGHPTVLKVLNSQSAERALGQLSKWIPTKVFSWELIETQEMGQQQHRKLGSSNNTVLCHKEKKITPFSGIFFSGRTIKTTQQQPLLRAPPLSLMT